MDRRELLKEVLFLVAFMAGTWLLLWFASPQPDPFFGI